MQYFFGGKMDNILERLKTINVIGLIFLVAAIILVYGSKLITKVIIKDELKRKSFETIVKLIGFACTILAMLLITKTI